MLIVVLAGWIIENFEVVNFTNSTSILAAVALIIPLKAIGSLNANLLFAQHNTVAGTYIHAVALLSACLASFFLIPSIVIWGAVIGSIVGELIACSLLIAFAKRDILIQK